MARRKGDKKKAGKAGGDATMQKHGPSFYREIGSKGGSSRRKNGQSGSPSATEGSEQ